MSSGKVSDNGSSFEVNLHGSAGIFSINKFPGDDLTPEKLVIRLNTSTNTDGTSTESTNRIIIDKRYTKVLSHWFRQTADLMDKWYTEETEDETKSK